MSTETITEQDVNDVIYEAAVKALPDKIHLVYVDYRDSLTEEQAAMLIEGDLFGMWESIAEWEMEARHEGFRYEYEQVIAPTVRRLVEEGVLAGDALDGDDDELVEHLVQEFECSEHYDWLRDAIHDRDVSDPIADLAHNTPRVLTQVVPDEAVELEDASAESIASALEALGVDRTDYNVNAVADAAAECYIEGGGYELHVIVALDPGKVYDLPGDVERLTFVQPRLLLVNPWNGSGMDTAPIEGIVTVKREDLRADSTLGWGSWNAIAGVVTSYYEAGWFDLPPEVA